MLNRPFRKLFILWVISLGMVFLGACQAAPPPTESLFPGEVEVAEFTWTPSPVASETPAPPVASVVPAISPTIGPLPTDTLTPTPDPYAGLTIQDLIERSYGEGEVGIVEALAENSLFTRYLVSYPSDGLAIYGFMNVPKVDGPLPVVIALHGYIDPAIYQTLDYTTSYADELARNGYLVIHPNLRGYPPSDDGENLFRVGMAIDVLNLIAIVQKLAGSAGPLEKADGSKVGLWGHSMGGGVTTRVITVDPDVKAAVLYGAMSGDEQRNYQRIYEFFSDGTRGLEELGAPPDAFERISPIYFYERIQAAVSIHHGTADGEVPPEWSQELCSRLGELNKTVECFTYPGQPHTFNAEGNELFNQRVVEFFNRYLRDQ